MNRNDFGVGWMECWHDGAIVVALLPSFSARPTFYLILVVRSASQSLRKDASMVIRPWLMS